MSDVHIKLNADGIATLNTPDPAQNKPIDDVQPEPVYDFKFDRLGNYDYTTVSLTATLPFRKLYLLYALPALILRAYWEAIKKDREVLRKEEELDLVQVLFDDEKQAMEDIEHLTRNVELFKNSFPYITRPKGRWQIGRKISLMERLKGRVMLRDPN